MSSLEVEEEKMNNKGNKSKQEQCNSINFDDSQFPDGMKVLAVDENAVCLKIITTLLHKCRYQVTAMNDSAKALMLLKQKEDSFDIVLTNVQNTGQIDGFKLLEAGLELDIPVIMISAMDDIEIIKKGVIHGARHFLLKPVCLSEIKNIWQHVYRKNISKFPNIICDGNNNQENKEDLQRKRTSICIDDDNNNDNNNVQSSEERKRIRWTQPLHAKFVDAVLKLGGVDKAVPTKILDIMKENDITREKVASHLQKYRKSIKNNFGADNSNNGRKRQQQTKEENMANSDQSILIPSHIASRHHLPTANGTRDSNRAAVVDYQQSNTRWSVNSYNQPQQLDIRPSQVIVQQPRMVQLGGSLMGGPNLGQGNHHHHLQQQPHHHMQQYGDFRSLYSDSVELSGNRVTDEFDDWPLFVAPPFEAMPGNGYSFDGELNNMF